MKEYLTDKINNLPASATLTMAAKARELKNNGIDIIGLSLGEPDFNTPDFIKNSAIDAINQNYNSYTPVDGYLELKEAICKKFHRDNKIIYNPNQIVVSTGAKQSIANVVQALIKPGEEVKFSNTVVRLDSVDVEGEMNFDTVVANFSIQSGETQSNLKSEKRVYKIGGVITSETGIVSTIQKDYHIVLGDRFQDGSWSIRYSINYGIMLIWISSILLLLSMLYGTIRRHGY